MRVPFRSGPTTRQYAPAVGCPQQPDTAEPFAPANKAGPCSDEDEHCQHHAPAAMVSAHSIAVSNAANDFDIGIMPARDKLNWQPAELLLAPPDQHTASDADWLAAAVRPHYVILAMLWSAA